MPDMRRREIDERKEVPSMEWDYRARIQKLWGYHETQGLWILRHDGHKTYAAKRVELEWEELPEAILLPAPTLALPKGAVAAIAHALIETGDLPETLKTNARELKALESHLSDLRKIAFNELGIGGERK
jgi:hypothetical protein